MADASDADSRMERFKTLGRQAFVLGYTGEVGKMLVEELNKYKIFKRVVLIGRRQVPLNVGPEFEQAVVDFDRLTEHQEIFAGIDTGFCCLGTTRGQAGKAGFIKVDKDYVLAAAEVAKLQGCQHFSLVSSVGADKDSCILYKKTKGEVEEALRHMNFDRLSIYRPGLLLCDRQQRRPMEKAAMIFLKPITSCFPTLLSVPTATVAKAMLNNVVKPAESATELYENKDIHLLAKNVTGQTKDKKS